ncbi:hypothetical protein SUGI_1080120 [Cryptomeria japonica]|nr:hypothetical protein SUGI_1080120 [Cryptomeria japonica]
MFSQGYTDSAWCLKEGAAANFENPGLNHNLVRVPMFYQGYADSAWCLKEEAAENFENHGLNHNLVRVPMFSQGYADSAWCLKEEATANFENPGLNHNLVRVPMFSRGYADSACSSLKDYNSYKKSVLRHYSHPDQYPEEEIAGWKRALEEICSRSDWSMEIAGGFEAPVAETLDRD